MERNTQLQVRLPAESSEQRGRTALQRTGRGVLRRKECIVHTAGTSRAGKLRAANRGVWTVLRSVWIHQHSGPGIGRECDQLQSLFLRAGFLVDREGPDAQPRRSRGEGILAGRESA